MEIALTEPNTQLAELVTRAESGEEIVLTRDGRPVARLTPVTAARTISARRALIEELQAQVAAIERPGMPDAAHSQDFLYGDDGLPA